MASLQFETRKNDISKLDAAGFDEAKQHLMSVLQENCSTEELRKFWKKLAKKSPFHAECVARFEYPAYHYFERGAVYVAILIMQHPFVWMTEEEQLQYASSFKKRMCDLHDFNYGDSLEMVRDFIQSTPGPVLWSNDHIFGFHPRMFLNDLLG